MPYSDDWGYIADETIEKKYPANGVSDIKANIRLFVIKILLAHAGHFRQ